MTDIGTGTDEPHEHSARGLDLGQQPAGYRSGFVCIVGRPNVGKSTLLNQFIRAKVAITSDKPQTTRNTIRGILTTDRAQLVFVDTPGLHKPRTALGKRLNHAVRSTLAEVEVVVFMIDVADGVGSGDAYIANELRDLSATVIVALNKLDVARPANVQSGIDRIAELGGWGTFGVSAKTGAGVSDLLEAIVGRLPEGPVLYPPDALTDQPERRSVAELVREKVLAATHDEVPHSVAVEVDEIDRRNGTTEIAATIYVERDSQKGIVIGRGGAMLKDIGTRARKDIETLLGGHVRLDLRVKVEPDWQRRDSTIARFGYGE